MGWQRRIIFMAEPNCLAQKFYPPCLFVFSSLYTTNKHKMGTYPLQLTAYPLRKCTTKKGYFVALFKITSILEMREEGNRASF